MKEFQAHLEEQLLAMGYLNCEQLQQAKDLQSKISTQGKALWSLNRVTQVEFLQVVVTGQTLLTHWLIDSGTVLDLAWLIF